MNIDVKIKPLSECPEHIPSLAQLWYDEISKHWVPGASVEKAREKLIDHLNNKNMPMAFVATQEDKPVGMACLRITDGIQPDLSPWLGSLVVHPQYRGCKIGETLIDVIKHKAKAFGYDDLYLLTFDSTLPDWYQRLGWKPVGNDALFEHKVVVMTINI